MLNRGVNNPQKQERWSTKIEAAIRMVLFADTVFIWVFRAGTDRDLVARRGGDEGAGK